MYEGMKVQLHTFLISVLDGGQLSASHLSHFNPEEKAPIIHQLGCLVGHRAGLGLVAKRKILLLIVIEPWLSSL
jgi:hypothetical protein